MTTVVHCKKSHYDVYIGRPTKWGNPFLIGRDGTREEVIEKHNLWLLGHIAAPDGSKAPTFREALKELKGKVLGCWCKPEDCHGDTYARYLDKHEGRA